MTVEGTGNCLLPETFFKNSRSYQALKAVHIIGELSRTLRARQRSTVGK